MRGLLRCKVLPDRRVEGFGYPTIIRNLSINMKVETRHNKLELSRGGGRMMESGKPNLEIFQGVTLAVPCELIKDGGFWWCRIEPLSREIVSRSGRE